MSLQLIIPFRDRGNDPLRQANLDVVMAWWYIHGMEARIVDDGLTGDAPFNRHRAYNRAVAECPNAEVFVFTEADMLLPPMQVRLAARWAYDDPGLVVPFMQYRYLSASTSDIVREVYEGRGSTAAAQWWSREPHDPKSIFNLTAEHVMDNGRSIGAVNAVSRNTLNMTGGFTELTHGNWYDDNITEEGFAYLTGQPTRFVSGPAVHLYHLPGHKGDHLTRADKAATEHNRQLLERMRMRIRARQPEAVRDMMKYRAKG